MLSATLLLRLQNETLGIRSYVGTICQSDIMNELKENTSRLFFKYAIPSVLGMLAISSASIVDGLFIGNYVGALGLAAINITMPVFSLLFGLSLMIAIGSSVVSGKLMGQGDTSSASIFFSKAFIFISIFSVLACSLLFFNVEVILTLFGANTKLLEIASDYLGIMLIFIPFLMLGIVLDYFVKVDGQPLLAFYALLTSAITNIVLDWFFIIYLEHGIKGAALATGISHLVLFLMLLPHFFLPKSMIKFVKPKGDWLAIFKAALNGASEFVNETSAGITILIFNYVMIKTFDVEGVAAFAVIHYILWVGIMISFGISDSLQPLVSKNFGAREPKRIAAFLKLAFLSISLVGLFIISLLLLMSEQISTLFLKNSDQATKVIVLSFMTFIWPVFLVNGLNLMISAYFTAIHKPFESACIALSRSLIFPIVFVMTLPYFFENKGIFMAIPAAEFVTFIISIVFFLKLRPQSIV